MLIDSRVDAWKSELDGAYAPRWRRLAEQCDWYRGQQPPAEHPSASITYFGPAAANLALAYRLTGFRGYLDETWRWISTAISYPHWGKAHMPDHDLDAGWLLHGLSLAYDWLGTDLPQRDELGAKLALQGERLYDFAVASEGSWWSSSYWQNHNWICYTGLAAAGYALNRPEWTERAKDNFAIAADSLAADGSGSEGVVYWRYGVPWLATYLDLLSDQEGIDWWKRCEFLANTFRYRLHQCAPGFEENIDHGDCHDRRSGHSVALYYKLASQYRIGEAQWLADLVSEKFFWREAYASGVKPGVMPESYLEFLWYDSTVDPVEPSELSAYFPDLGLVAARTSWDPGATMVSFKSSPGGGHTAWDTSHRIDAERGWDTLSAGHHHPDSGSFVLTSHGAFLAVDEGYSNRKRAGDHNLILVDGQGFAGEDRYHVFKGAPHERQADLTDVVLDSGVVHAMARIAAMYPAELNVRTLNRSLVFTPAGRVVLLDRCVAEDPRTWTLLLHADWPIESVVDGHVLRSGSGQAWVRMLGSECTVDTAVTQIEANPTSSTPSLVLTKTLHTLRASSPAVRSTAFLTAIEPTSALSPSPSTATLAGDRGVSFEDETVLFADDAGHIDAAEVVADASAVVIAGEIIVVVNARRVVCDGELLLDSEEPVSGRIRQ